MEKAISEFIMYLHEKKHSSNNTEVSYRRDLEKLCGYLKSEKGITSWKQVTVTHLSSYILKMENEHYAASSISRGVASFRSFFEYLLAKGEIDRNPVEGIKPPKAEKKAPQILSIEQVAALLSQPDTRTSKGVRDLAMLELLYATGIRVSELIGLKLSDVNLRMEYITCGERSRERVIPFGSAAKRALTEYLEGARETLTGAVDSEMLFPNCQGKPMSRQGFWKILKGYVRDAGIEEDITPHTLRHSFAVHMIANGADLGAVKEMMGHSDISTTQMYLNMNLNHMRDVYEKAHPRG